MAIVAVANALVTVRSHFVYWNFILFVNHNCYSFKNCPSWQRCKDL